MSNQDDHSKHPLASRPSAELSQAARWDQRYAGQTSVVLQPARVLTDYGHLLPSEGVALDLACGLGGNALWLAKRGLTVSGWDLSALAIERLSAAAAAKPSGLKIDARQRDVLVAPPPADSFDVVVVSHFLERQLAGALSACLRPGGLLFYQTFSREQVDGGGPRNPAYRLARGELLTLFSELEPLAYRDEGRVGDLAAGFRNQAMLVAQRPLPRPESGPSSIDSSTLTSIPP